MHETPGIKYTSEKRRAPARSTAKQGLALPADIKVLYLLVEYNTSSSCSVLENSNCTVVHISNRPANNGASYQLRSTHPRQPVLFNHAFILSHSVVSIDKHTTLIRTPWQAINAAFQPRGVLHFRRG